MKRKKKFTLLTFLAVLLAGALFLSGCEVMDGVSEQTSDQNAIDPPVLSDRAIELPTANFTEVGYIDTEIWGDLFEQEVPLYLSDWLPTLTLNSTEDLKNFVDEAGIHLDLDGRNGGTSALSVLSPLGDAYFADNVLLVCYFVKSTGGHKHEVSNISIADEQLSVGIRTVSAGVDAVMEGWLFTLELPRDMIQGVTEFKAYLDNTDDSEEPACAKITTGSDTYLISGADAKVLTDLLAGLTFEPGAKADYNADVTIEISSDVGIYEFRSFSGLISCDLGNVKLTSEQFSLLSDALGRAKNFMPEVKPEAHYTWVNWVDEEEEAIFNGFAAPAVEGTQPVVKISSREELDALIAATESHFSLDSTGMNNDESFMKLVESYDDSYFAGHSLLIAYVTEGSGSITHKVIDFSIKDESLTMQIRRYSPLMQTCDMAGWFITVEVNDSLLTDYTAFGAIVS